MYNLNEAIIVLKNECSKHELCEECPFVKISAIGVECQLHYEPYRWKLLKGEK